MRTPAPHEIVKVSSECKRTTVNPDGDFAPIHIWLCENGYRYWQILADELLRYTSNPAHQFHYNSLPLNGVMAALESHGHFE